jgi:hypothetical protein
MLGFNKVWKFHTDFIRNRPVFSAYVAWTEGVVMGVLLMYFLK